MTLRTVGLVLIDSLGGDKPTVRSLGGSPMRDHLHMAIFSSPGSDAALSEAVFTIFPYRHDSAWVFDDDRVGLVKEPFVSGIDVMIDRMTAAIPNAAAGFRLDFSAQPFDGWQKSLTWLRADPVEGNWYWADDDGSEGWLCPALFWYFPSAPERIYVRASARV